MYRLHLAMVLSSILKTNAGKTYLSLGIQISLLVYICSIETGNGALRLIRDNQYSDTQAWSSGIVQIYYGVDWGWYRWGNICDDVYFSSNEAEVICHQLGYTGASSFGTTSSITQ